MANLGATYSFIQHALSIGEVETLDLAMAAGTYTIKVGTLRDKVGAHKEPWTTGLLKTIEHLDQSHDLGRFRMLQTAWNRHMSADGQAWARGLRDVAIASTPKQAFKRARKLEDLPGAGKYQLGQIVHLLHPRWFAVMNRESRWFWEALGFKVGGLKRLNKISRYYRDGRVA